MTAAAGTPFATRFVRSGDVEIAYQRAGEGLPLVLVHGFTGSKLDFSDHVDALAREASVIAFDQRGHGESSHRGPYRLDTLVSDLLGLLERLDVAGCDLLGHSLGGMVAMRAALAQPHRFRSLLLMDTAPGPLRLWTWWSRLVLQRRVRRHGCRVLLEDARAVTPTPAQQRGIDFLGAQEHWRRREQTLGRMDARAFCELMDELQKHPPVTDRLSGLACPVTVMVGACDLVFQAPARELADRLPDARLVIIPDADHSPQLENAAAWRATVLEHRRRLNACDSSGGNPEKTLKNEAE